MTSSPNDRRGILPVVSVSKSLIITFVLLALCIIGFGFSFHMLSSPLGAERGLLVILVAIFSLAGILRIFLFLYLLSATSTINATVTITHIDGRAFILTHPNSVQALSADTTNYEKRTQLRAIPSARRVK